METNFRLSSPRRFAVMPLAALLLGCSVHDDAWAPPQSGDCYDVAQAEWVVVDSAREGLPTVVPDSTGDSLIYALPVRIHLDSATEPRATEFRAFDVPDNALQIPLGVLGWRLRQDSLQLLVTNQFSGTYTWLLPEGEAWAGEATTFNDNGDRPRFRRAVTLKRTDCESPPPVPASADRPLPRSITLLSGATITLGLPVPTGVLTSDSGAGLVIREGVAPPLAEADSLRVELGADGLVRAVTLTFPAVTREQAWYTVGPILGELVRALESEYGAATRSPALPEGLPDTVRIRRYGSGPWTWTWTNRTTHVSLSAGETLQLGFYDPRLF